MACTLGMNLKWLPVLDSHVAVRPHKLGFVFDLPSSHTGGSASAQGSLLRRKNLALPVAGSCTLRSVGPTVGLLVIVSQVNAGSEVAASRT